MSNPDNTEWMSYAPNCNATDSKYYYIRCWWKQPLLQSSRGQDIYITHRKVKGDDVYQLQEAPLTNPEYPGSNPYHEKPGAIEGEFPTLEAAQLAYLMKLATRS